MAEHFEHLGVFSDWVAAAKNHSHIHPTAAPGAATCQRIRDVLGFSEMPAVPTPADHYPACWPCTATTATSTSAKEKIADGPDGPIPEPTPLRTKTYRGQAFANALALRGFVVLVHDVFLWGSRRFPLRRRYRL
jgi:hypothetical protein